MPVLASKDALPAASAPCKQKVQEAEPARPVVVRRLPPHDRMTREQVAAASRALVARLLTMDHMVPRPGSKLPADGGAE